MIPQSTTLQERLEFYEWALREMQNNGWSYICFLGSEYYELPIPEFKIKDIKRLFLELYDLKTDDHITLWVNREERIEALQKAIIEVKRKIEEDGN